MDGGQFHRKVLQEFLVRVLASETSQCTVIGIGLEKAVNLVRSAAARSSKA
jgi:hypothetical protein